MMHQKIELFLSSVYKNEVGNETMLNKTIQFLEEEGISFQKMNLPTTKEIGIQIENELFVIRIGRKFCPIHEVPILVKKQELKLNAVYLFSDIMGGIQTKKL